MGMYDACGPNVANIIAEGSRVIRGRVPQQVRKELALAVKLGQLSHERRNGLLPEIYYHPNNKVSAMEIRRREMEYGIACIAKCMVSGREKFEFENRELPTS